MEMTNTPPKMDRQEIKTEWEKPDESKLSNMSPQEMRELLEYRTELFDLIAEAYQNYIRAVYKLPIHVIYRQHAFLNLDQSFHWIKAALDNVFEVPSKEEKPEPNVCEPVPLDDMAAEAKS